MSGGRARSEEPHLDLKRPENAADPYPVYAALRDADPVHWSPSLQAWVATRYDDVREIFDRPDRFSSDRFRRLDPRFASERPAVQAVGRVLSKWLVFRDAPDHTRLRALLQKSFTTRQLALSRSGIQFTIDRLLDPVAVNGEMDFVRDFAFPLPATVIAVLLGAPRGDIEPIKRSSDQLAAYLGGSLEAGDNFDAARSGLEQLVDYFRSLLARKKGQPAEDLMSLMLAAEDDGDSLSEDEVVANCVLLVFAGHETTTNLLANGLFHLLREPGAVAHLRQDPALVPTAVEELLRIESPVPATMKVAACDLVWHGREIRAGEMVLPFIGSANRDPRRFREPDVLDLSRDPNRHLAFGFGLHFCLGAPLARLEARLAFDTLVRRFPRLGLRDPEPVWKPLLFFRALESLPVSVDGG